MWRRPVTSLVAALAVVLTGFSGIAVADGDPDGNGAFGTTVCADPDYATDDCEDGPIDGQFDADGHHR